MKTLALILTLCLFAFSACKDKEDKGCDKSFLQADINKVLWEATELSVTDFGTGGNITLIAKANYGIVRELGIQVLDNTAPGTYDLQSGVFTQSIFANGTFQAEIGQLTITENDTVGNVFKGTFFFGIPSEGLDVRAGSFCVSY